VSSVASTYNRRHKCLLLLDTTKNKELGLADGAEVLMIGSNSSDVTKQVVAEYISLLDSEACVSDTWFI
jgi:hypothetical protein